MTETEQIIVGLISSAGQSKSLAFEALKKVKQVNMMKQERY